MRITVRILITVVMLVLYSITICPQTNTSKVDSPNVNDYSMANVEWVSRRYNKALEQIFSRISEDTMTLGYWRKMQWCVSAKITPTFSREVGFVMTKSKDGHIHLKAILLGNRGLFYQLLKLHKDNPSLEYKDLLEKVLYYKVSIFDTDESELKELSKEMENMHIILDLSEWIVPDATSYEIQIESTSIRSTFLVGISKLPKEQERFAIVRWMNKVHNLIEKQVKHIEK